MLAIGIKMAMKMFELLIATLQPIIMELSKRRIFFYIAITCSTTTTKTKRQKISNKSDRQIDGGQEQNKHAILRNNAK